MNQKRDFVMARISAASTSAKSLIDDLRAATELFCDPEDDDSGEQRMELLEQAELTCHAIFESLTGATGALRKMVEDDDAGLSVPEIEGAEDDEDDDPEGDGEDDAGDEAA